MDDFTGSESKQPLTPKSGKVPVVRGARACSVCRLAKMKCVGAEDGTPCQRCKRTGQECIFEKHKRGRKPGSKLSEASKMLRKLEKGLHNAKAKSHAGNAQSGSELRGGVNLQSGLEYDPSMDGKLSNGQSPRDDEDDDEESRELYPSKIIHKETHRNSFFNTILNPQPDYPMTQPLSHRPSPSAGNTDTTVDDVITLGIITEVEANKLFDFVFLRLNPFINLFDPSLHTAAYVRSKSRFLFTTLMMAICKFFEPKKHKQCYDLANEMATKAFTYGWKSVEVVQAFACLTYYKDADDTRTWTLIGFACRMAIELGLDRYHAHPPERETTFQRMERRNRERTYLVLFIHDRSLSTQTGRSWMLPERELVQNAMNWHQQGGSDSIRPEDVIVAAFVQLRLIAAETTEKFLSLQSGVGNHNDLNYDLILRESNNKLSQWSLHWEREMQRANADTFHISFINLFRLYIRLFLNSFGLQAVMSPASASRFTPGLETVSACYQSALDFLKIVFDDILSMGMLCYSQDSITIMSAYAAISLLRLLKAPIALHEDAAQEFYHHINKTADAYAEASAISPAVTYLSYHARFLRTLVADSQERRNRDTPTRPAPPRHEETDQTPYSYAPPYPATTPSNPTFPGPSTITYQPNQVYDYPAMNGHLSPAISAVPTHASSADQQYWRTMFGQLGYQDIGEPMRPTLASSGVGYMTYGESQRYQSQQIYGPPSGSY